MGFTLFQNLKKLRLINYKMKTRQEIEAKQFSLKMKIAKLKKKSFVTRGQENNFHKKNIEPLQKKLIELNEKYGKLEI